MAALDYDRETVFDVKVPDDAYRLQVLSEGDCPVHGGAAQKPNEKPTQDPVKDPNEDPDEGSDLQEDDEIFGVWGERNLFTR